MDRGVYILGNRRADRASSHKFVPAFSDHLHAVCRSIRATFPYTDILVWETRILLDFMRHQPASNLVLIEIEREAAESVFNFLNDQYAGSVFLEPDRKMVERYVLTKSQSMIVSSLITQAPRQEVDGIPCPKMEKILVDLLVDDEIFFIYHGRELVNIYETVFERHQISEKTLFRYAGRRNARQDLEKFINTKTEIELVQFVEARG